MCAYAVCKVSCKSALTQYAIPLMPVITPFAWLVRALLGSFGLYLESDQDAAAAGSAGFSLLRGIPPFQPLMWMPAALISLDSEGACALG